VDRAERIKGITAGADDFLSKPFDREEFVLQVRNALNRKRLYDELARKYAELKAMAEIRESLTRMIDADTDALSSLMRQQAQGERVADGISD
jgi:DNA-binding response OmpR family regulator